MSRQSDQHGMYGQRAVFYDAIYHTKTYDTESLRLRELLNSEGVADGSRVIEAACGTGSYLVHLKQWFAVMGFDISEDVLKIAQAKLPDVELSQADMTDFDVKKPADALLCLFSSIGYVFPASRLRAAAECFAKAVRPGGILIVEPWVAPEDFMAGRPWLQTFESDDLKLCRAVVSRREDQMSRLNFHWLAATRDAPEVQHFSEEHLMWLCPRAEMLSIFEDAGFACRLVDEGWMKGRGLIVGRRKQ